MDPEVGVHTNNRMHMGIWQMEEHMQRGTARHHLLSFLSQLIWRQAAELSSTFDAMLKDIEEIFPPKKKNVTLYSFITL